MYEMEGLINENYEFPKDFSQNFDIHPFSVVFIHLQPQK